MSYHRLGADEGQQRSTTDPHVDPHPLLAGRSWNQPGARQSGQCSGQVAVAHGGAEEVGGRIRRDERDQPSGSHQLREGDDVGAGALSVLRLLPRAPGFQLVAKDVVGHARTVRRPWAISRPPERDRSARGDAVPRESSSQRLDGRPVATRAARTGDGRSAVVDDVEHQVEALSSRPLLRRCE